MITSINIHVLDGEDPDICNVAERLSWAASKEPTRIEDAAYCLLGIFRVHMPLLYGEGKTALVRLQEQILKTAEDYTLLAQGVRRGADTTRSALAGDLDDFRLRDETSWSYSDLALDRSAESFLRKISKDPLVDVTPTLTAKGLFICLPLRRVSDDN